MVDMSGPCLLLHSDHNFLRLYSAQVGHLHRKWPTPVLSNAPCWTKAEANSKQMIWPVSLGLVGDKPCYFWLLPKKILSHTTGGHCPKDCLLSSHKPADLKQIHFNITKPHTWILSLTRKCATWKCPLTPSQGDRAAQVSQVSIWLSACC